MLSTPTRDSWVPAATPAAPTAAGDFVPGDDYFAAGSACFGSLGVPLAVGPLNILLRGLAASQVEDLGRRYAPFVSEAERAPDLTVELRDAGLGAFLAYPAGRAEVYRMGTRRQGGRLCVWAYEFAGYVDAATGRAVLCLVAPAGPQFDRGLENFLRVMTASFILDRGGLLVHAACVVRDGKAHIFFGPSGSGKTTVTRLSPRDTVLSDDMTLVVPTAEGFRAAGIPFGMAHHRTPETNAAFPVASLNRLVQSDSVRRERIAGARAVAEIAASLPFVMQEAGQAAQAIDIAARLLREVPLHRLYFRKDDSFWKAVGEA